jgi:RNA polymerase sigma factor (sigma-70 family)
MLALLPPVIVVKDQPRLKKGHLNETVIVAALVAGDTRALEKLYAAYSAALLGIISRIIKQEDLAEDILQETFLKIWKSINQYDPSKGRLFTWMARLAKNKAIDHLRSRGEMNSLRNDDLAEFIVEVNELHQIRYNPEFIGIRQLINTLTPEQTIILDLVYFQGYTQVEVADMLGIPVGTVKTRIRAAIKAMRSFF